jgi:uncharacterized protein DUF4440
MHPGKIPLRITIAVCAAMLLSSAVLRGQQSKAANQDDAALINIENHWLSAENDPDALQNILADDFVHVLPAGFISKDEHIAYLRKNPMPLRAQHFGEMRVRIYGDVGIVNGTLVDDGTNGNVRKIAFTDVFVRRNGQWQAVNAQELPIKQ